MAKIVDNINSILARLGEIPYDWEGIAKSSQDKLFQLVAMWNSQNEVAEGGGEPFDTPACFLEMNAGEYVPLLGGMYCSDVIYRVRIVMTEFDSLAGTKGQNLSIFEYRNLVKKYLCNFTPINGSSMFHIGDMQDDKHGNTYTYIMDFKSAFMDNSAYNSFTVEHEPDTNTTITTQTTIE